MYQYKKYQDKSLTTTILQKENINKYNINWPWNPDHWCRPLIITGSGQEKQMQYLIWQNSKMMMIVVLLIKFIFVLRTHMKQNINVLLKISKKNGLKNRKDLKTLIKYSINMHNVCKNIEEYNPSRKCNVLIVLKWFQICLVIKTSIQ